jgi:hypothetical protein
MNRTGMTIGVAFLFFAVPGFSNAARIPPAPLLAQMEQGYGVIAAIVEKATLVPPRKDYPTCFDVRFKVHALLAQPVTGDALPAKVGSTLELRVSVGYGCLVEMWGGGKFAKDEGRPLAVGKKFLLTVKYDKKTGEYEHAYGTGVAKLVADFTLQSKTFFGKIHALAKLPLAQRLKQCRELVSDSKADPDLRSQALWWVRDRVWLGAKEEERKETAKALLLAWNQPTGTNSIDFLDQLDYALRIVSRSFERSEERENVWLAHIFAPFPVGPAEEFSLVAHKRGEAAHWKLRDFRKSHPKKIANRLMKELAKADWPLELSFCVAGCLQTIYEEEKEPNPAWERALQSYYPRAIGSADPWELRCLAMNLMKYPDRDRSRMFRSFQPGPATEHSLQQALKRMQRQARDLADREAQVAIRDLEKLLQQLNRRIKGK